MSVRIMSEVWDLPHLNPSEKLLLLAIADHCNDDGVCYPSAARLQEKCNWSTRTYTKYIGILKEAKLIKKTPRASTRTGRTTDLIEINHSNFYTGKEFDRLRVAREKSKVKTPISLHGYSNLKNQQLSPPFLYTGKEEPLGLYQGKNNLGNKPSRQDNSSFDLEAECSECLDILDELDKQGGVN